MTVKNALLGGVDNINGDIIDADDVNDTNNAIIIGSYVIGGLNLLRILQDRSIDFSKGQIDWWGDSYIDTTGQMDSVVTGSTTSTFDTDKYLCYVDGSNESVNGDAASTNVQSLSVSMTCVNDGFISYLECDLSVSDDTYFRVKKNGVTVASDVVLNSGAPSVTFSITDYSEILEAGDTITVEMYCPYPLNIRSDAGNSHAGTNFTYSSQVIPGNFTTKWITYTPASIEETIITQNIPTGTFSSTVSKAMCAPLVSNWEDGANIQYKLQSFDFTSVNENSYVQIEATEISSISDFEINSCKIAKIEDGKWLLMNTNADDEIARAKIYQTLFYNGLVKSPYIKGLTALKTSITRDVGKRAHYSELECDSSCAEDTSNVGTFANTSTNTDCSSWSSIYISANSTSYVQWENPTGTVLNGPRSTSGTTSEFGLDMSADETDNPATCKMYYDFGSNDANFIIKALVLCNGDITWVKTGSSESQMVTNTDYYSDYAVPDFESTPDAIPSSQSDSGYLDYDTPATFPPFIAEPVTLVVKLVPKTSSPSPGYPAVYGFALRAV